MAFPVNIDTFSTKVDGVTDVLANDINSLQNSVLALENKVGINVSWAGVTGSRVFGSTYTNSTSSKRVVIVNATAVEGVNFNITAFVGGAGVAISGGYSPSGNQYQSLTFIVPPFDTYSCVMSGAGSMSSWAEIN